MDKLAVKTAVWHNIESMNPKTFFFELRRRNVLKVAAVYAVTAWLLIQTAVTLLPAVEAPSWLIPAFLVFLVLGFGLIVFISWAFEATPEGMKRTENVPRDAVLPSWSPRKFAVLIVTIALLATSLLAFDLLRAKPASPPATAAPELINNQ
jgi:hypothetical protein